MKSLGKLVPDTSVIVEGLLSLKVEKKELKVDEVIVHEAVIAELEHQANSGKAIGFIGLDELKKIRELAEKGIFALRYAGRRPTAGEIKFAELGEVDALIRQLAYEEDATLLTADKVQARVGEARQVKVIFIPKEAGLRKIRLESFFDETTMSVHLRENVFPMAKKGVPGKWEFVQIGKNVFNAEEIKDMSREIIEEARLRADGFIEIEREGSTIIQLGPYRIVITKPPLSDGWEITAVKPIKKLGLDDYSISEKLRKRIAEQAEGMLIAGSPGHGKTTFAQALAEHFLKQNKIVKTVEAPRDLILPDSITQLAISRGSPEEIHDILLLSRPDYTIFDEMRNTPDFQLFADLRLSGVGMVGVVHGTGPIDAIQRFIGRIELGVIPQVIDTVVFIKNGAISQVLAIKMSVKVPSGMTEADLARPVVVISEFETEKAVAEVYSYGEETVVVPVMEKSVGGVHKIASESIRRAFQKYADYVKVDVVGDSKAIVYVPEKFIAGIIGREGKNISRIEDEIGLSIEVRELGEKPKEVIGKDLKFELETRGKNIELFLGGDMQGKDVNIYINDDYLATFNVGKKGVVRIDKGNKLGKALMDAMSYGERIRVVV